LTHLFDENVILFAGSIRLNTINWWFNICLLFWAYVCLPDLVTLNSDLTNDPQTQATKSVVQPKKCPSFKAFSKIIALEPSLARKEDIQLTVRKNWPIDR